MSTYPNPPVEEGASRKPLYVGLALILLVAGGWYLFGGRSEKLQTMSAAEGHVALGEGAAEPVTEIERSGNPEVYYHVVLKGVPLGWRLELGCEWIDPAGGAARHNIYETRIIHKSAWPTHCRQQFGPSAPAGQWQVHLMSGKRVLSTSSFILK
jgi:hypothetical protein